MRKIDLTWHEVLSKKGFDSSVAECLIGFIAWEKDNIFSKIGREINDVLLGYEGKVIAKDVSNARYNNIGILFVRNDISDKTASEVFDTILKYEHEEVYDLQ